MSGVAMKADELSRANSDDPLFLAIAQRRWIS
jgi:hypothetical protein